jgi:hypothetical protein
MVQDERIREVSVLNWGGFNDTDSYMEEHSSKIVLHMRITQVTIQAMGVIYHLSSFRFGANGSPLYSYAPPAPMWEQGVPN